MLVAITISTTTSPRQYDRLRSRSSWWRWKPCLVRRGEARGALYLLPMPRRSIRHLFYRRHRCKCRASGRARKRRRGGQLPSGHDVRVGHHVGRVYRGLGKCSIMVTACMVLTPIVTDFRRASKSGHNYCVRCTASERVPCVESATIYTKSSSGWFLRRSTELRFVGARDTQLREGEQHYSRVGGIGRHRLSWIRRVPIPCRTGGQRMAVQCHQPGASYVHRSVRRRVALLYCVHDTRREEHDLEGQGDCTHYYWAFYWCDDINHEPDDNWLL